MQIDLHSKPKEGEQKKSQNFTSFPMRTPEEEKEIAKASGWKENKEDLEKEGKKFVDAEEFNRRGELIKTISKQSRAIKNLERKIAQQEQQDAHFQTMHQAELQKAYEKAKADLKAQKLEYIGAGEHKEAAKLEETLDELEEAHKRETLEAKQKASQGKLPPEVQAWMDDDRNAWYSEDEDLAAAFEGILAKQIRDNKGMPIKDVLAKAEEKFAAKHPDVYAELEEDEDTDDPDDEPKKRTSKVAAPSGTAKRKQQKSKYTWNDLPDDFTRSIAQTMVDQGTFKTRQAYVDKYFAKFGKEG